MLPKSWVTDTVPREGPSSPGYDWFQTDSLVTVVIYTRQKNISVDSVVIDLQDALRAEQLSAITLPCACWAKPWGSRKLFCMSRWECWENRDYPTKERESFLEMSWSSPEETPFIPKTDVDLYRKCQLVAKEDVTYDTKLFCLILPPSTHLQVPIGQHVYLKLNVTGAEIVNLYNLCLILYSQSLKNHFFTQISTFTFWSKFIWLGSSHQNLIVFRLEILFL